MTRKTKAQITGGLAAMVILTGGLMMMSTPSPIWFDTGSNCASQPSIDRVFGSQSFQWQGSEFVAVNQGNEISIRRVSDMRAVATSAFNVPNMGDSDYDLYNFSVCNDCRYGVASYKLGSVFFDLGAGTIPQFYNFEYDAAAKLIPGAYTFEAGAQYLIAESQQCSGSALYRFDAFDSRQFLECVTVPGRVVQTVGGFQLRDALYLTDKTTRVYLMQYQTQHLQYVSQPWTAYSIKDSAMDIDAGGEIASVANNTGLHLYDVTQELSPIELAVLPGSFNRSTISYPLVMVGTKGFVNSEHVYDVSTGAFVEVDVDFDSHPNHQCAEFQSGEFVQGGDKLILTRYSYGDQFDSSGWAVPATPTPIPDLLFKSGFESGDLSEWQ